jgi:very-short-patch-repair endonuclease
MCKINSKILCGSDDCTNCIENSFKHNSPYYDLWDYNKNDITPEYIHIRSNKQYWFTCIDCKHSFQKSLNNFKNHGCPYCKTSNRIVCDNDNCTFCFNNSFASHPMAESWSINNTITPRKITKGCDKKYEFVCKDCNHTFSTVIYSIKNTKVCPYCCDNKILCHKNDCKWCYNNSLIGNIPETLEWSSNNNINPRELVKGSNKKYCFNCKLCKHEIYVALNDVQNGKLCAYCANQKLCSKEDCNICFNKSFASHERILEWDYAKNKDNPRNIFKGSEKKYWFNCKTCKLSFNSMLYNLYINIYYCPTCQNKTETILYKFLLDRYDIVERQKIFDWCIKNKRKNEYRFDFYIESINTVIELDGKQHFEQISNWTPPDINRANDIYKINKCIEHGVNIIHLLQEDVWNNKNDWSNKLLESIKYIGYKNGEVIFIDNEKGYYNLHKCDIKT